MEEEAILRGLHSSAIFLAIKMLIFLRNYRVLHQVCFITPTRIVGDNVDLEQTVRIHSHKTTKKSLHWFQIYAVKDKVPCNESLSDHPQRTLVDLEMKESLPTADVHSFLIYNLVLLIPRIVIQYLPAYQPFEKAVKFHISHAYSAEMAKKFEVVCETVMDVRKKYLTLFLFEINPIL